MCVYVCGWWVGGTENGRGVCVCGVCARCAVCCGLWAAAAAAAAAPTGLRICPPPPHARTCTPGPVDAPPRHVSQGLCQIASRALHADAVKEGAPVHATVATANCLAAVRSQHEHAAARVAMPTRRATGHARAPAGPAEGQRWTAGRDAERRVSGRRGGGGSRHGSNTARSCWTYVAPPVWNAIMAWARGACAPSSAQLA